MRDGPGLGVDVDEDALAPLRGATTITGAYLDPAPARLVPGQARVLTHLTEEHSDAIQADSTSSRRSRSRFATTALAQDYPNRPVRIIVPYPVGGASDITARLVADKLSKKWGQGVVVENKAGANGIIGTEMIAKAPPDGYTLGLVASSHVGNPFSYKVVPFDTLNDLVPITQTANVQLGLVVNPSLGVNSVAELVALLKSKPGKIDYASTGPRRQSASVRRAVHAALPARR